MLCASPPRHPPPAMHGTARTRGFWGITIFATVAVFDVDAAASPAAEQLRTTGKLDSTAPICIIGAGPGGIQLGHSLSQAGREYLILERNASAGSYFQRFPVHRKLISLNKRRTGRSDPEFNLRHDWCVRETPIAEPPVAVSRTA